MRRFIILLSFCVLAGCSPTLKQSSAAGGYIQLGALLSGEDEAVQIAEAECAKHNKAARITGQEFWGETMTYECVAQ